MAQQNSGRSNGSRLTIGGALATGVKEMPRNASWLIGKALTPIAAPRGKVEDVRKDATDKVRSTRVGIIDALPGLGDSVELRLKRAHAAADDAKAAEERSVSSAREAERLAKDADRAEVEREKRVEQVRSEHQSEADARVREVEQDAERRVAEARADAEAKVEKAVAKVAQKSDAEVEQRRNDALKARQQAEQDRSISVRILRGLVLRKSKPAHGRRCKRDRQ